MKQKWWFLFAILFWFSVYFKHSFLLFRLSGGKKNRKRILIKFYKTEGLGEGGSSTSLAAFKAGFSALPLCEKSVPLLSRSLAWSLEKTGSNSHLYYSFRNGRWEWVSSFMWQIWNAFHQVSQALIQPVSPSLSLSQGGASATKPVKELPTTPSPAEHIVVFVPSTESIQLLLQPGNKSYYQHGQQIPVSCSCCLNILHQIQGRTALLLVS